VGLNITFSFVRGHASFDLGLLRVKMRTGVLAVGDEMKKPNRGCAKSENVCSLHGEKEPMKGSG